MLKLSSLIFAKPCCDASSQIKPEHGGRKFASPIKIGYCCNATMDHGSTQHTSNTSVSKVSFVEKAVVNSSKQGTLSNGMALCCNNDYSEKAKN